MPRTDTTIPHAETVRSHSSVAGIAARGLRAMLLIEPCFGAMCVNFLALGADGRYRSGAFYLQDGTSPSDLSMPSSHPFPEDEDALAETIAKVVEANDLKGTRDGDDTPFTLAGWFPSHHGIGIGCNLFLNVEPALLQAMAWLPQTRADGAAAYEEAWSSTMAGHVPQEALAAARAFSRAETYHPLAFDLACERGPAGDARRAFVRANPLVAVAALSDDRARALVDAGRPVAEVLDALPSGTKVLNPVHGDVGTRKRSLAAISGAFHSHLVHEPMTDVILSALDGLPLEWAPKSDEEMRVFALLCRAAAFGYGLDPVRSGGAEWWRAVFAGAKGRWPEFYVRVCEAATGSPFKSPSRGADEMVVSIVAARAHVVEDLLVPLARAYGGDGMLGLFGKPGEWLGLIQPPAHTALHAFAHRALTQGMVLPALADQGRRQREARKAIREVGVRFPPAAGTTRVRSTLLLVGSASALPAAMEGFEEAARTPGYDASAPGAIDAMLAAWRPALPRRYRSLDARALTALIEHEIALAEGPGVRSQIH